MQRRLVRGAFAASEGVLDAPGAVARDTARLSAALSSYSAALGLEQVGAAHGAGEALPPSCPVPALGDLPHPVQATQQSAGSLML